MVSSNASNINISVHTRNHFSLDVELPSRWCFRNLGDIPCPRKMWLGQLKYVGIMMFPSIWAKNVPNYQPRIHGWIRYVLAKLMEITKHPVICIFLRFLLDTNNIQITTIVAPRVWVKSWPLLLEGHVFLIPNKCPIMNLDLDGWALFFSPFFFTGNVTSTLALTHTALYTNGIMSSMTSQTPSVDGQRFGMYEN